MVYLHLQCVLVKGWKGTSWSFPRGKKNKDEEDDACAIREVNCNIFATTIPIYLLAYLTWGITI